MSALDTYIDQINRLPVDIRAEVLLANLLENGLPMEELLILPIGLFKRNFQNDIGKARVEEMTRSGQKRLCLEINRDGLYDSLPEGIFHQPSQNKPPANKKEVLKEIKQQQERENAARRFFLPLEQEYYRLRVKLILEERKYLFEGEGFFEGDLFSEFWNFPAFLTPSQIHNLLYLLPMVHRIAGDWEQIRLSFETLLEDTVNIIHKPPLWYTAEQPAIGLGEIRLGVDWIMGDEYVEVHSSVLIQVLPTDAHRIQAYLPGGPGEKLIRYLSQYLFPMETDYKIEVKLLVDNEVFVVDEETYNGRLGYTTYL
ncbi:type VI secretion system baseplate subunit TssG [Xanthocytophaga flava]|uniref:type VI secretion system baseplate subunit TssG n=1 Tax=Xanthocytophaga flava TaxID=3048013 RepID=UPI0028D44FE1|nr:type VI secretion system baseplate subunit TssG [Xanthocytophaga flavus]MDJ1467184.1 type VI secretion system baseplate subunit TssG [Xanthocytophaga flavus]